MKNCLSVAHPSSSLARAAGLLLLLATVACGKEDLKELDQYQIIDAPLLTANVDFCSSDAEEVRSRLKFIFVMDKSGSNQNLPDQLGTDVDGKRRYTPLLSYLDESAQDDTVYYSLVNFSTEAKIESGFTNDVEEFTAAVTRESNPGNTSPPKPADQGWTNFKSALGQVSYLIEEDIKAARLEKEIVSSYYVVFFISDGAPWVGTDELQDKTDILSAVAGITAFQEGNREYVDSIQIHTGYYYNDDADADARSYMKDMADRASGQAYEFSAGQIIDFSQFSVPARNVSHTLRDVLLTNTNIAWEAGELLKDTDGDGVNDRIEDEGGSKIDVWDSDGNGISDAVEWIATGKICADPTCLPSGAEPYLACEEFKRDYSVNGQIYDDKDKDGLNDCEEQVILKSKLDSFDSNEDWLPDQLALLRGLALANSGQEASLDPDLDDMTNYNEVKVNTPANYPNDKILGLLPYRYELESNVDIDSGTGTSTDTATDTATDTSTAKGDDAPKPAPCYRLRVSDIFQATESDLIRVYLMEATSIIDKKRYLRVAEKRVTPGVSTIDFVPSDFQ